MSGTLVTIIKNATIDTYLPPLVDVYLAMIFSERRPAIAWQPLSASIERGRSSNIYLHHDCHIQERDIPRYRRLHA